MKRKTIVWCKWPEEKPKKDGEYVLRIYRKLDMGSYLIYYKTCYWGNGWNKRCPRILSYDRITHFMRIPELEVTP